MSFLVGPTTSLGHPFVTNHEVPTENALDDDVLAYAFHIKWLYTDLRIQPAEPFEAMVLWDPGWLRSGEGEGAMDEIRRAWEIARELDVPIIGVYSDWFASWKVDMGLIGTLNSLMYCDAIVTDPAGSASLRAAPPMRITDPLDHRYRPVSVIEQFLTYGRLPTVGRDDYTLPRLRIADRSVDVAMVSTLHPQHVVLRPFYVELLRDLCARNDWSFEFRDRASAEEMEALYLDAKVVVNVSLGCQANYRVYEALACGALLVTDGWNIGIQGAPCLTYSSPETFERAMHSAMEMPMGARDAMQEAGVQWASRRSPRSVWLEILRRAREIAPLTESARRARIRWEDEMRAHA